MTQLATVVLKDSLGANVSFAPRDIVNGVATTVNSSGIPLGDKTYSLATSRTQAGRRKATLKFALPVVQTETLNGVARPTVVRTAYCDVNFSFDGTSSTLERSDMLAAVKAALADTVMTVPLVQDLSAPY